MEIGNVYLQTGAVGVLLFGTAYAIKWLLNDRKELISALHRSHERERQLSERRADELLAQAKLLAGSSEVVRESLAETTRALNELRREVENATGS